MLYQLPWYRDHLSKGQQLPTQKLNIFSCSSSHDLSGHRDTLMPSPWTPFSFSFWDSFSLVFLPPSCQMFLIFLCCLIVFCPLLHVWAIKGSCFDLFPLDSLHLATLPCPDGLRLSHLSFLTMPCSPLLPGPWAQGMVQTVAPCPIPSGGPQLLRGHTSEELQLVRIYAQVSGDKSPVNRQAEVSAHEPSSVCSCQCWKFFKKQNWFKLIMSTDIIVMAKPSGAGKISHGALASYNCYEKVP